MKSNKILNIEHFISTPLLASPFPYLVVQNFINNDHLEDLANNYPVIAKAGSYPLNAIEYNETFGNLIHELQGESLRQAIADKFSMDLSNKPSILTFRGQADPRDGRIHTDSESKLMTMLLYMNNDWQREEGCLRLLYDDKNLDHYAAEIPPTAGTALFFKVTRNGWHGHKSIKGIRRVIQLNYLRDNKALTQHQFRHRLSASFKRLGSSFKFRKS